MKKTAAFCVGVFVVFSSHSLLATNSWSIYYSIQFLGGERYQYDFIVQNNGPDADAIKRWTIFNSAFPSQWGNYDFVKPSGWGRKIYSSGSISFYTYSSKPGRRIYGKLVPGAEIVYSAMFSWQFDLNGGISPYTVHFKPSDFSITFQRIDDNGNDYDGTYKSTDGTVVLIPEMSSIYLLGIGLCSLLVTFGFRRICLG